MSSSNSSSTSDKDYESGDSTTNSEGPESENKAIPTYTNNEYNKDEDINNKAIPRHITCSSTHATTLFTNTPDPDIIDDKLLRLHATIRNRSYLPNPPFEPLPH